MVARVRVEPESIRTDPTAVWDFDDPEVQRLVEEKPWLQGDGPIPTYWNLGKSWIGDYLKFHALYSFDQRKIYKEQIQNSLRIGGSIIYIPLSGHYITKNNETTYSTIGDSIILGATTYMVSEPARIILQSFSNDIEFIPQPIFYRNGKETTFKCFQMNVRSLYRAIHP